MIDSLQELNWVLNLGFSAFISIGVKCYFSHLTTKRIEEKEHAKEIAALRLEIAVLKERLTSKS